jgi:hypothetical protein
MARAKGSTVSPETRAKMKEAAKRRWAERSVDVSWNLSSAMIYLTPPPPRMPLLIMLMVVATGL